MSDKDFLINNRDTLQRQVLGETTEGNTELAPPGSPLEQIVLQTNRKIVIPAINEILQQAQTTEDTTSSAINTLLRDVIGDYKDTPSLLERLKEVDEGIIQAIYKLYSMLIGNPADPHPIEDFGSNIYEILQDIYNRVGDSPVPKEITSEFEYYEDGSFKRKVVTGDEERTSTIYYAEDGSFDRLVVEEGNFTIVHSLEFDPETGRPIKYKREVEQPEEEQQEGGS